MDSGNIISDETFCAQNQNIFDVMALSTKYICHYGIIDKLYLSLWHYRQNYICRYGIIDKLYLSSWHYESPNVYNRVIFFFFLRVKIPITLIQL